MSHYGRVTAGIAAAAGMLVAAAAGWAAPARAQDDTGTTTVNVVVSTLISISGQTASLDLNGNPGDAVTSGAPVELTVATNNPTGYTVSVAPATASLAGADTGNTDTIPFTDVEYETSDGSFAPLTFGGSNPAVHSQTTPSAAGGDTISHDYQINVPFVAPDTYSGEITYTAVVNQ